MAKKNITISLDAELLEMGRRYAKVMGTSINELFREFIRSKVVKDRSEDVAQEMLDALDAAQGRSSQRGWKRDDAYTR
jgi:hypothetical protein